ADGPTNARVDVGRVTSEVSGHGLYASYNNATCRSTPAAVYQGQYVLKRIIEYDRHTIGKRKSECYSWLMSDECVGSMERLRGPGLLIERMVGPVGAPVAANIRY